MNDCQEIGLTAAPRFNDFCIWIAREAGMMSRALNSSRACITLMARQQRVHRLDQMKMSVTFFLTCLVAATCAPLVIPFTGGGLFFLLHEWFYPSVWGLPPLQSLIGVSINCTAVGYFFTWVYALPLVFILRGLNRYRLRYLLVASALPALSLPFWQMDWTLSILPVLLAGMSTAYAFWRLTNLGVARLTGD